MIVQRVKIADIPADRMELARRCARFAGDDFLAIDLRSEYFAPVKKPCVCKHCGGAHCSCKCPHAPPSDHGKKSDCGCGGSM